MIIFITIIVFIVFIVFIAGAYFMGNAFVGTFGCDFEEQTTSTLLGVIAWVFIGLLGMLFYGIYDFVSMISYNKSVGGGNYFKIYDCQNSVIVFFLNVNSKMRRYK